MKSEIKDKMSFDQIRYSSVWEDHLLLERGLDINREDDVLSICSAGCNVFALLLQQPRTITAIDLSPAQTALLELQITAIKQLEYESFITLMGVTEPTSVKPIELYREINAHLSEPTRRFWEANRSLFDRRLFECGRLEQYIDTFRAEHLPGLLSRPTIITELLTADSPDQQHSLFEALDTRKFAECFRWYFGREMMAQHGRDPAQFEHIEEGDVGAYFHGRLKHVCTNIPTKNNFYLERFFLGHYVNLDAVPPHYRARNYQSLKQSVDRIRVVTGALESFLTTCPTGRFSKMNLSDAFEYMSESHATEVFGQLADRLRPGGRLAYWNLLVPRAPTGEACDKLLYLRQLSETLWLQDRSWFYRAFRVEERR